MDREIVDTIQAWQLEPGDIIDDNGNDITVKIIDDYGDLVTVTDFEDDEYEFSPESIVRLVSY